MTRELFVKMVAVQDNKLSLQKETLYTIISLIPFSGRDKLGKISHGKAENQSQS
jgi:hypothetical protein